MSVKRVVQLVMLCMAGLLPLASAADGASIDVGTAAGIPGQEVQFNVTLNDMGERYAATGNDIAVDPATPFVSCAVNPDINKTATTFGLRPEGCVPGVDCTGLVSLVISFSNLDRIPNGSVLYSCTIRIADDAAEGTFPLTCSEPEGSDRDGDAIPTDCTDGSIQVSLTTPTPTATPDIPTPAVTSSRLAAAIGTEDVVISLLDASQFPDAGTVVIDGEILRYRAKADNTLTEVSRGEFGTPVTAHLMGALVTFLMTEGGGGGGGGCAVGGTATGAGDTGAWGLVALAAALLAVRGRREC